MSATILPAREYRREMEKMPSVFPHLFENVTSQTERDRNARNCLGALKIYERADYGLLADLREVIALHIAPWLAPQTVKNRG